jgi:hypothetical protein
MQKIKELLKELLQLSNDQNKAKIIYNKLIRLIRKEVNKNA